MLLVIFYLFLFFLCSGYFSANEMDPGKVYTQCFPMNAWRKEGLSFTPGQCLDKLAENSCLDSVPIKKKYF